MRRSPVWSLVVFIVIAVGAFTATLVSGESPQLGLDLQGGASVVLQPREDVPQGVLDQAIDIIRSRVDALGVAEPEITRQGESIIVSLPGVENRERALQVVGQTAQLLFRPVIQQLPAEPSPTSSTSSTSTTSTSVDPAASAGASTTTTSTTLVAPEFRPTTAPEDDDETKEVILPEKDREGRVTSRYLLAPAEVKGTALSGASANVSQTGQWEVQFELTGEGTSQWNAMAAKVGAGNQIAIDLDGVVRSAPRLEVTEFQGRGVITGNFTQSEAKDLALVLRYGALPVQLDRQTVQTVSATLGRDTLRAGVGAGLVGLGLVAIYMLLYYRALGIVVWIGLLLTAAIMYSLVTLLGNTSGLALSLAGAVGIIVSVGVTVDSYVVYFERLKDEIRSGKTVRSSLSRGFSKAYRTILAANSASIIGAAVLYVLSVGSVRGFVFFLGLTTLLDLFTAYFFTRPMVMLLGQNRLFTEARWVGVARGLNAAPAVAEPRAKGARVNESTAPVKRASLAHRLYHGETAFDFVGRRRIWFVFSAVVILAGLLSLGTQGLNLGIDFEGGTSWEVPAPGVSVAEARDAVRPLGLGDATIQIIGDDRVRVASDNVSPEEQERISRALAEVAGADLSQVSVNDVGPSWGQAVTNKARNALVVFFVLISIYISLRFEWKMAVAALAAVVHDIFVTVGVYSISRFEVTPATVVAFLTILGYSLYDTIVVFDKVEENVKGLAASGRFTYSDTVNLSMNQVLMRSLNTSIVAIMPIVSILVIGAGVLGATALNDFGLALLIGLLTGAYSSIYIAAPILAMLKEREPRYAGVRQRLMAKSGAGLLTPAAAAALAGGGGGGQATLRPRAGAKSAPRNRPVADADANGDSDLPAPSRPSAARPADKARPKQPPRPGAPRPRKKGKKR